MNYWYNFKICQRSNGTYYGIADGKQCLSGQEVTVTREQLLDRLKNVGLSSRQISLLNRNKDDEKVAKAAEKILEVVARRRILNVLSKDQKIALVQLSRKASAQAPELEARPEKIAYLERMTTLYNNSASGRLKPGSTLYPPEVAKRYVDYLETGRKAIRLLEIDDESVDRIWSSLPSKIKQDLARKGVPNKEIRDSYEDLLNDRGKFILKKLLETGFRDEITGQPYSWRELNPDHVKPLVFFKKNNLPSGDAEKPENVMIVHSGYNTRKGLFEKEDPKNLELETHVKQRLLGEYTKQSRLTQVQFEELLGKKLTEATAREEKLNIIANNAILWDKNQWKKEIGQLSSQELAFLMKLFETPETSKSFKRNTETRNITKGAPTLPATGIRRAALLLKNKVPFSQWPPEVQKKALNDFRKDIAYSIQRSQILGYFGTDESFEREYVEKFKRYIGSNRLPRQFMKILEEMVR